LETNNCKIQFGFGFIWFYSFKSLWEKQVSCHTFQVHRSRKLSISQILGDKRPYKTHINDEKISFWTLLNTCFSLDPIMLIFKTQALLKQLEKRKRAQFWSCILFAINFHLWCAILQPHEHIACMVMVLSVDCDQLQESATRTNIECGIYAVSLPSCRGAHPPARLAHRERDSQNSINVFTESAVLSQLLQAAIALALRRRRRIYIRFISGLLSAAIHSGN
jgi:hypothetical protein